MSKAKSRDEIAEQSKSFFRNLFVVCGVIQKLRNFHEYVRTNLASHDSRNGAAIFYPYEDLFCIIFLAGMAGFKTKGEIHDFWVVNRDKLDVIFPGIGYEVPSTSTITRANHLIAAEILEDEFIRLFGEEYNLVRRMNGSYDAVDLLKRDVIACDGQAIRSTTRLQENGKKSTPFEITSMVSYGTGITIGQMIHDKKNQEKKAILKLSDKVDVKNAIFTWDAINTYIPLIENIISKGADVCVRLKRNQKTLYEKIARQSERYDRYVKIMLRLSEQDEKAQTEENRLTKEEIEICEFFKTHPPLTAEKSNLVGGKLYERHITVFDTEAFFDDTEKVKWKHIKTAAVIKTKCTNMITKQTSESFAVHISSIPFDPVKYPSLANDLLEISVRHWCVETNHWHIDEYFDQDGASYSEKDSAVLCTSITKCVMSMFNFAKLAYANEEDHYVGECTTPKLQRACMDVEYSALLIDSFFQNNPKLLTEDELSYRYHFMKRDNPKPSEEKVVVHYEWESAGSLSNCPLAQYIRGRGFKKIHV